MKKSIWQQDARHNPVRVGVFMTKADIIIPVKDAHRYIGNCVRSLLGQTFPDFELLIIEDGEDPCTERIVERFGDPRIRYFRNEVSLGIGASRNRGLKLCEANYVFFTDGDYVLRKDWIEQGLKSLSNLDYVGVEGKTYYVSEDYVPTYSDHVCVTKAPGNFMTGNVAYRRDVLISVGGFDQRYSYFEDRDLALRILRKGKITFNPLMVAYAQQQTLTHRDLLGRTREASNRVYLYKRFGDRKCMLWRILLPWNLAKVIFPPVVFSSLLLSKFDSSSDFELLPFKYVYALLERLEIWKTCAKERVFLI
jgi:glycosyltransferase involved in cell wall biosynthesis